MPDFVGSFKLMLNNERIRQMEYDGKTVNYKRNLDRVKKITLMVKNSFHSLNVSNAWNINGIHKNLLEPCYNCEP